MRKLLTSLFLLAAFVGSAFAQPATTTVPGTLLTYPFTATGKIITLTPTAGTAGLNLPQGVAPSSPVNGDIWITSAGLFFRVAGVTAGPIGSSGLITNGTPVTGGAAGNVLYTDGTKLQAYAAVPISILGGTSAAPTITGNSILGNWTNGVGAVGVQTMPTCADTSGQHLNYVGNVGITCGNSGTAYTIICNNGASQGSVINTALAAGGTVTLSPGICNTNIPITWAIGVPATLKGAGQSLTIINQTSGSADGICVQCTGTTSQLSYAGGIYDLTVKGSSANTANGININYVGENANGPSGWVMNNITVIGFTHGIRYNHEWYTRNSNIEVNDANTAEILIGDATTGNSGGDLWTNVQMAQTSGVNTSGICVEIINTGGQDWTNVACTATQYGVLVYPGSGQSAVNIQFNNAIMDNNGLEGWRLDSSNTGTIYHFYCSNCWGDYANSAGGGVGLVVNGASGNIIDHVSFSNSNFPLNRCQGIYIQYANDVRITGSTVVNNNAAQGGACGGAGQGIYIAAATTHLMLNGNYIGNSPGTTTQLYGLYATSTVVSASDYWMLETNSLSTNATGAYCFFTSSCANTPPTHSAIGNNM